MPPSEWLGGDVLKRTILSSLVIIIALTLTGAGCLSTTSKQASKAPVTLTVWQLFDSQEAFNPIIQAYQDKNPNITINYVKKDYNEYELQTSEALAAGKGPDIWMIRNDWMPRHNDKIVPMPDGALASNGKSDLDNYKSTFPPIVADDNIIDGKIYGIPFSVDTLALYYNADIFNAKRVELENAKRKDEAKLFENPPATWDDFIKIVKLLTEKSGKNITKSAVAMGTSSNIDKSIDILTALMLQNGTPMTSVDNKAATFNLSINKATGEPVYPGTQALDFYTSFANPNKETYTWNSSMSNSLNAFMDGEVAMMFNYSYIQQTFAQQKPTLNYGIGPLPQIKGTTAPIDYASYWTETVTKNSKNSDVAWDFLLYVATQKGDKYATGTTRPNPYSVDSSSLPTTIDLRSIQRQSTFAFQKMSAKNWYKGIRADKTDTIMSDMIENVVSHGQPLQTAIDGAAAQETVLLNQGITTNVTTATP